MNLTSPKNWKTTTLEQVIDLVIDHRGKTPTKMGGEWADKGHRALSAKNIKDGRVVQEEQIRFVDEALYKKWMPVEIQKGDILLTSEGPLGEYCYWNTDEKIVLSQRLFGIRTNQKILDSKFFFYLLGTPFYRNELFGRATGTTVEGIRQSELLKTKVIFPESLDDQREIAAILGSIDDKIELLRRENKTLESIAQALFKEWFVEFRFPGYQDVKMVDGVPEGWKVGKLGDVLSLEYGKPLKEEVRSGKSYPVIGSNGIVGRHDEFLIKGDGIVVGRKGTMGSVTWIEENFYPIDTTFYVVDKLGLDKLYFHLLLLKNTDLTSVGSDSAVPGLNRNAAYSIDVVIPNLETLEKFNDVAGTIFGKIKNNNLEMANLTLARDSLLNEIFAL